MDGRPRSPHAKASPTQARLWAGGWAPVGASHLGCGLALRLQVIPYPSGPRVFPPLKWRVAGKEGGAHRASGPAVPSSPARPCASGRNGRAPPGGSAGSGGTRSCRCSPGKGARLGPGAGVGQEGLLRDSLAPHPTALSPHGGSSFLRPHF